jgi:hypothetical protein
MKLTNRIRAAITLLSFAIALSACGAGDAETSSALSAATAVATTTTEDAATESATTEGAATASVAVDPSSLPEKASYSEKDLASDWTDDSATKIVLSGDAATVYGDGASVDDGVVTIAAGGTYVLNGSLANGSIVVDAPETDDVRLILNGVDIASSSGAALYIKEAEKTIVTLAADTDNFVSDGASYVFEDGATDEPSAVVFSRSDLTFNGEGSLTVQGNYKDGIASKDDLKIVSGAITVKAVDDGLVGRDLVAVRDGSITVEAGGDGVKSTNEEEAGKGHIAIEGGSFAIVAGGDGLQSAASIRVDGGDFKALTGGGSANGPAHASNDFGGRSAAAPATTTETETDATSMKAFKATANLSVMGGAFDLDSADDGLHAGGGIAIVAGELKIASGDDGIHADASIAIAGGVVDIAKSYEGIESAVIELAGGDIRIVASDDGVNVSGGADGSGMGGGDEFAAVEGDGLDSNGSAVMTDGTVLVNGPTGNGNGALDYNGTFEISGGVLAAAGSAGMASAPSGGSTQRSVMMTFSAAQAAGTTVQLKDADGNVALSVSPTKTFQTIVLSAPDLKEGGSYTLVAGNQDVVAFELGASAVTWLNESGVTEAQTGGPGGGGFRGGRGRRPPGTDGGFARPDDAAAPPAAM